MMWEVSEPRGNLWARRKEQRCCSKRDRRLGGVDGEQSSAGGGHGGRVHPMETSFTVNGRGIMETSQAVG